MKFFDEFFESKVTRVLSFIFGGIVGLYMLKVYCIGLFTYQLEVSSTQLERILMKEHMGVLPPGHIPTSFFEVSLAIWLIVFAVHSTIMFSDFYRKERFRKLRQNNVPVSIGKATHWVARRRN